MEFGKQVTKEQVFSQPGQRALLYLSGNRIFEAYKTESGAWFARKRDKWFQMESIAA